VIVEPLIAETVPLVWGGTMAIASIVQVPFVSRVSWKRISSPTLRSARAAVAPSFW
jgi:hypothetical protein